MESLSEVPFIRFMPAFIAGVIYGFYEEIYIALFFSLLIVTFIIFFLFNREKSNYKTRWVNGILFQFLFFGIGVLSVSIRNENCYSSDSHIQQNDSTFIGCIQSHVMRNGRNRAEAKLICTKNNLEFRALTQNCLLYFPDDSAMLQINDFIVFKGPLTQIKDNIIPGQFDWKYYSDLHRISFQKFLKPNAFLIIKNETFDIRRISEAVRKSFLNVFPKFGMHQRETAVVSALVLGYDDEINPEVMKAFSASGTLHILSVSGMHVAIIFSALSVLFKAFEKNRKLKVIRLILLISALWLYALLTGFSPSVIRSAMMFTLILFARHFTRNSNIYNSLLVSALLIFVLIDPLLLFFPGFQLSFLAVFGIVFLFPMINKWYYPKNPVMKFCWSLIAVSLAAQAGTLPVSLFYFHQFPNYFILANLLIIPLSTVIIFGGIALLFLSFFPLVAFPLAWLLEKSVFLLDQSALFIESLPGAVTKELYINLTEMTFFYLVLYQLILFFRDRSIRNLLYNGWILVLVIFVFIVRDYENLNRKELVIYGDMKTFGIEFTTGFQSCLYYKGELKKLENLSENYCRSIRSVDQRISVCLDSIPKNCYRIFADRILSRNRIQLSGKNVLITPWKSEESGLSNCFQIVQERFRYPKLFMDENGVEQTMDSENQFVKLDLN